MTETSQNTHYNPSLGIRQHRIKKVDYDGQYVIVI